MPPPEALGKPVYEQSEAEMEGDRRTIRRSALLALALIPLLITLFYLFSNTLSVCRLNIVVLVLVTSGTCVAFALWMLRATARVRPWRMYEDGIAFTTYPNLVDRYYRYTDISVIREESNNVMGNIVLVRWPGMEGINLHMENPRTPDIVAFLRRKMGAPGESSPAAGRPLAEISTAVSGPAPTTFAPEYFRQEKWFYVGALASALVVSALMIYMVPPASRGKYWFLPLALFPTIAVNCLAVATMVMDLYVRGRKLPVKFNLKLIGGLLLALNLMVAGEAAVADPVSAALDDHTVELVATPAPLSGHPLADKVSGETLELDASLLVAPGRTVTLESCTVRFRCQSPRQYSLWVAEGGRLEAVNCTFASTSAGAGFGCEFHGAASLVNCSFDGLWGDPERLNGDGGVEIWNDSVSLSGCRITNAATNGLFIVRASPAIRDTAISACGDENVEMHRSGAVFTNCTFRDAGWGIIAWDDSRLRMEGCRMSGINETGVDLVDSKGEVLNCTLEDIDGSGIRVHRSELVSYSGTTFTDVNQRIDRDSGFGVNIGTCLIMNVMLSVFTIVNILLSGRRRAVVRR
jgi:hypothetical protein